MSEKLHSFPKVEEIMTPRLDQDGFRAHQNNLISMSIFLTASEKTLMRCKTNTNKRLWFLDLEREISLLEDHYPAYCRTFFEYTIPVLQSDLRSLQLLKVNIPGHNKKCLLI